MKPMKHKAQGQKDFALFWFFLHAELFCTQNAQNLMNRNATQILVPEGFCDFCGFCVK